jgi:hypothetical protein
MRKSILRLSLRTGSPAPKVVGWVDRSDTHRDVEARRSSATTHMSFFSGLPRHASGSKRSLIDSNFSVGMRVGFTRSSFTRNLSSCLFRSTIFSLLVRSVFFSSLAWLEFFPAAPRQGDSVLRRPLARRGLPPEHQGFLFRGA